MLMSIKPISKKRWQKAQEAEYADWTGDNLSFQSKMEKDEATLKYREIFSNFGKNHNLDETSKIVDIGCNVTVVSTLFGVGNLFGVDPLMDQLGNQLGNEVDPSNFLSATGENVPFKSNKFDVVVCRNVIDHCFDPEKVLSSCNRILKFDGKVLVAVYVYSNFIYIARKIQEKIKIYQNIMHPFTFTEKSFINEFEKYFRLENVHVVHVGLSPWDFGKHHAVSKNNKLPKIQKVLIGLVMFVNAKVFRSKFFVKEVLLIGNKKSIYH